MILVHEKLLFIELLFTDLLKSQQKEVMILMQKTLLLIEQLFTDLL